MNIYVSNLSAATTLDDLKQAFTVYGTVKHVVIVSDARAGGHEAGRHGYVEMTSKAEATTAISSLNGTKIGGRVINAVEALPLSNRKTQTPPRKPLSRPWWATGPKKVI